MVTLALRDGTTKRELYRRSERGAGEVDGSLTKKATAKRTSERALASSSSSSAKTGSFLGAGSRLPQVSNV